MIKIIAIILGVVIIILLGVLIFFPAPQSSTVPVDINNYPPVVSADGHLQVALPHMDALISSPVSIQGNVVGGGWFFEGTFPIKVLDGDGTVLSEEPAEAQGDWTSTGTVPFTASLSFTTPHDATGTIVFLKDNLSGLAKNNQELSIPVNFK